MCVCVCVCVCRLLGKSQCSLSLSTRTATVRQQLEARMGVFGVCFLIDGNAGRERAPCAFFWGDFISLSHPPGLMRLVTC